MRINQKLLFWRLKSHQSEWTAQLRSTGRSKRQRRRGQRVLMLISHLLLAVVQLYWEDVVTCNIERARVFVPARSSGNEVTQPDQSDSELCLHAIDFVKWYFIAPEENDTNERELWIEKGQTTNLAASMRFKWWLPYCNNDASMLPAARPIETPTPCPP